MAALLLSIGLVVSPVASAGGIPVIDAAAIAKSVEQLVQMKTQIDNQVQQIAQMKTQIQSLTGTRNLGNLLKDAVKDQVPDEWGDIYKAAKGKDYKVLLDGKKYDPEMNRKLLVQQYDMVEKTFNNMKNQYGNIDKLMLAINQTQDPKAIAELQARINTEQSKIQTAQSKFAALQQMMVIQEKIQMLQYKELESCHAKYAKTMNYSACQ
jgi:type IV secretion system protein VirB5